MNNERVARELVKLAKELIGAKNFFTTMKSLSKKLKMVMGRGRDKSEKVLRQTYKDMHDLEATKKTLIKELKKFGFKATDSMGNTFGTPDDIWSANFSVDDSRFEDFRLEMNVVKWD